MFSYVQTRWNSSLYMLRRVLQQKCALNVFAAEHTLPATVTAHQWELMDKTADVLSPFEELTRDVSRETVTAADVIPAITGNWYFYFLLILFETNHNTSLSAFIKSSIHS